MVAALWLFQFSYVWWCLQYDNSHVFSWLWMSFQDLHSLQLLSKHKFQQLALQFDVSKNSFNRIRISFCLFDTAASFRFEKNNNILCHSSHFVQRSCFMHWCSFIISWFMQRISDRIIFVFVLCLLRSLLSHQHDQTFF